MLAVVSPCADVSFTEWGLSPRGVPTASYEEMSERLREGARTCREPAAEQEPCTWDSLTRCGLEDGRDSPRDQAREGSWKEASVGMSLRSCISEAGWESCP